MDPNATLKAIEIALEDEDLETARERVEDLAEWLHDGGFEPDWNKYVAATEFYQQEEGF